MTQDGSVEQALNQPLSLTASIDEFKMLSIPDQARMRALAYMANKQWGDAYAGNHYVGSPGLGPARMQRSSQIADQALVYLDNAGDLFLDRPLGLFNLARLVAEGSAWSMGSVMSALAVHLDKYVLDVAYGTIKSRT